MMSEAPHPTSPKQWPRVLGLSALGLAALVVVGFIGSSIWLRSYLRSDAFRQLINQKTNHALSADGEFMPLHWSGFSVYSDGYAARGRAGSPLVELRADQVRAEVRLRGVFRRIYRIESLDVQRLRLKLGAAARTEPGLSVAKQKSGSDSSPVRLQRASVNELHLVWDEGGPHEGSLQKIRLAIAPEGNAWDIQGTGGTLRQRGWPDLAVESLTLRYQHPRLFVPEGRFKPDAEGALTVSGEIAFDGPPRLDLQVKSHNVNITPLLPEDWRARLHGKLGGSAKVEGPLDDADSIRANGTVSLSSGRLEALPVLDRIAAFTRTEQFRQFALQAASADFTWEKGRLQVTNLIMESQGLLRIEGGFVMQDRTLEGEFQVGVTPSSLRWLPGSQARVFITERDGYVWAPMRVRGPIDRLQEDLSPRLIEAAGAEVIEGVKSTVEQGARQLLDLLGPLLK